MNAPPPAVDRPVGLRSRFLPRLEGTAMIAVGLATAVALAYPTFHLTRAAAGGRTFGVDPWAVFLAAAGFGLGGGGGGGFLIVRGVLRFLR